MPCLPACHEDCPRCHFSCPRCQFIFLGVGPSVSGALGVSSFFLGASVPVHFSPESGSTPSVPRTPYDRRESAPFSPWSSRDSRSFRRLLWSLRQSTLAFVKEGGSRRPWSRRSWLSSRRGHDRLSDRVRQTRYNDSCISRRRHKLSSWREVVINCLRGPRTSNLGPPLPRHRRRWLGYPQSPTLIATVVAGIDKSDATKGLPMNCDFPSWIAAH
jgi:hypothetical protein